MSAKRPGTLDRHGDRIGAMLRAGASRREVAAVFNVHLDTVTVWKRRLHDGR